MGRLESIKERFRFYDELKAAVDDPKNALPSQTSSGASYKMLTERYELQKTVIGYASIEDIPYLIQRLEIAQKALEQIQQLQRNIRPDGEAWEYVGEFKEAMKTCNIVLVQLKE